MERNVFDKIRDGEYAGTDPVDMKYYCSVLEKSAELRRRYNVAPISERGELLAEITGAPVPEGTVVVAPFHFDVGTNIRLGKHVIVNYDCVLLDTADIEIGDYALVGPGAKIVTATHPLEPELRAQECHLTGGKPVKIGRAAWIGAGAIILPGVTVGDGATVGAGTVVTHDVEPRTVVVGNPARVIRRV